MVARDLAELSGGRFVLGLGTQVKRINEQRFSISFEHPAPRIGEAVQVIREVLGTFEGQPIDHRGRFYTVTMPPFPGAGPAPGRIPIHLAAVNEGMAEVALPMVDTLAVAGPPDECRERVEGFADAADRIILGGTWIGPAAERISQNHQAIMETFAPSP